jgi:TP901 family phage tail tape measure protein
VSDVNANIGIHFDTANALAQLRQLQAGLSKFNQSLTEGNIAAANAQKGINAQLVQSINSTGQFVASQKSIASSTASFTDALEKNKLSMGQYFRYTSAAATLNSNSLQGFFTKEKEILTRASKDRVKALQSQYIQLNNANGEFVKVLQVMPKHLATVNGQYADYATRVQMAAQRQQMLNQLIQQGSTQLLNFGKNTQWAGRQLMVGLTVPLTILGSTAAKTFRDMEQATVDFQRVYGDMFTSNGATDKAVADIRALGKEFTKFGVAATDTMKLAAQVAAMGLTGSALNAQVTAATKLSVLGQVSQQDALNTTISLQNAFGISSDELAKKIDYLNAVENQTILSIQDMTTAIPKAAPVVKQLGGNVEDLAFFLTAMREGGINASEGANALKSSLASIINPSKKATELLSSFGISIKGIVDANAGNLKGTVIGLAKALDTLAPLDRARAIETMFGKFQFARISTLLQNITKSGSQAATALSLAGASTAELAILSQREMSKVENAVGVKFQKSIENIKIQLMPIGKAFLQAVTPVVQFVGKILEKFNNLSDGTKKFVIGTIAVLGGIAPVVLMTVGLIANGAANLMKFFGMLRGSMAKLNGQNSVLGGGFDYLTQAEIENLAQSQALHTSHKELISTFNVEAESLNLLATAYANAASQARSLASGSPGLFNAKPGAAGAVSNLPRTKFANGGVVPGSGNEDTVPAMLTPGEVVLTKDTVNNNSELVSALINGKIKKYSQGPGKKTIDGRQSLAVRAATIQSSLQIPGAEGWNGRIESLVAGVLADGEKATQRIVQFAKDSGRDISASQLTALEEERHKMLDALESGASEILNDKGTEKVKKASASVAKNWLKQKAIAEGVPVEGNTNLFNALLPQGRQSENPQEGHQTLAKIVPLDQVAKDINIVKDAAVKDLNTTVDALKEAGYGKPGGPAMPSTRVVSLTTAAETGSVNRQLAETTPEGQQAYLADYSLKTGKQTSSMAVPYLEDVKTLGPERWKNVTKAMGIKFDTVAQDFKKFDDDYVRNVEDWISKNPGGFFNDSVKEEILSATRANAPKSVQTILNASDQIFVAIRTSLDEVTRKIITDFANKNGLDVPSIAREGDNNHARLGKIEARTVGSAVGSVAGTTPSEIKKNTKAEVEAIISAKKAGAELGSAATDGIRGPSGTDAKSPSKKGINAGKEVGDGLIVGMQEKELEVASQAGKLGKSAIPTMQGDKVDVGNKAFYDEMNNPADREERQVFKSEDRQRRKLATISSSKLSKIVEQHTKDLANSTESSVLTQQEINKNLKESAIATAKAKIADQKLALQKEEAALIPNGSQTGNIPSTYVSNSEAQDIAADIARDKNGQIIMDPQTNSPYTKKQLNEIKRGMRRERVGQFSGKAAGALGVATMVSGAMGAPGQVTAGLGIASTVASLAPALAGMGPVGIAVTSIAAAGAAALYLKNKFDEMVSAQVKYVESVSATTEKMKKIGEITGKVGASELYTKLRAEGSSNAYTSSFERGKQQFGTDFLSSDVGKAINKGFVSDLAVSGSKKAAETLALQLSTYISDGVLSAEQAYSVARQIGLNLGNMTLGTQIQGKITELVGPDGKDILNNPLDVRVRIIQEKQQNNAVTEQSALKSKNTRTWWQYILGLSNQEQAQQFAALNASQSQTLVTIQAQRDAQNKMYDDQVRALEAQKAATTDKAKQLEIDNKIKTARKQQADDDAVFAKKSAEQRKKILKDYNLALKEDNKGREWAEITVNANAVLQASAASVKAKFTGDSAPIANALLAKTKDLKSQAIELQINTMVAGGDLDPTSAIAILDMFGKDEKGMMKTLTTALELHDPGKVQELITLTQSLGGKLGLKILVDLGAEKDPVKFANEMNTLQLLSQLDSKEINIKVFLQKSGNLESLSSLLDKIDQKVGKNGITLKVLQDVQKVDPNMPDLSGLIADWQKYKDQPASIQKSVLLTYTSIYKTIGTDEIAKYRAAHPEMGDASDAEIQGKIAADLVPNKITAPVISKDQKNPPQDSGTKKVDQALIDINKRLRDVRNSSILATESMAELSAALAKTGSKAVLDRFDGLSQRLLKLGKTQQFTDFLTGLDETELAKYGKRVVKKGVNPLNDTKDKTLDVGAFVLNDRGKKFEAGINQSISGDYNKIQLQSSISQQQELVARKKLVALGFNQKDIQTMLADENYRTLIATGKVTNEQIRQNAVLTQQNRIVASINSLYQSQVDAQKVSDNQQRIPEVVKMLQQAGVNAESIKAALSDPQMLQTLIDGMDNFATASAEVRDNFNKTLGYIDQIPDRKLVEIVYTQSDAEKTINGANAAMQLFDAYKKIDENSLKNAQGNTYAGLQTQMENLNNQAKIAQDAINMTQSKIDTMQQEVDKAQRDIETNFTRPIEARQRSIDLLNRQVEINYTRPIQAIQDRSTILSHDLEVMNHAADAINKKYDDQQTALTKIAEINNQIIQQQQQQLGLADALTKGDISAAAKAAQDMRATGAANYAQNAQDALQKARQNEIDALRGGISGKSAKDIQEEQYQNGLKTYDLEQQKAVVDKQILGLQDEIYQLEQSRLAAQDAIQIKTDAIAKIQYGLLLDQQNALKAINDSILPLQQQSDILFNQISINDQNRQISGKTRKEWDDLLVAATATKLLAEGDLARALGAADSVSGSIKSSWDSILDSYNKIKSKSIEIKQTIITDYITGTKKSSSGSTAPTGKANEPDAAGLTYDPNGEKGKTAEELKKFDDAAIAKYATGAEAAAAAARLAEKARLDAIAADAAMFPGGRRAGYSMGGLVPAYFATGGYAIGTDTVPAMLTPGEFVMSKYAVNQHGVNTLRAMNNGSASIGDSVYNYNLNINVRSDSSPDEIAQTVMAQIKQVDSQRLRGNRL